MNKPTKIDSVRVQSTRYINHILHVLDSCTTFEHTATVKEYYRHLFKQLVNLINKSQPVLFGRKRYDRDCSEIIGEFSFKFWDAFYTKNKQIKHKLQSKCFGLIL